MWGSENTAVSLHVLCQAACLLGNRSDSARLFHGKGQELVRKMLKHLLRLKIWTGQSDGKRKVMKGPGNPTAFQISNKSTRKVNPNGKTRFNQKTPEQHCSIQFMGDLSDRIVEPEFHVQSCPNWCVRRTRVTWNQGCPLAVPPSNVEVVEEGFTKTNKTFRSDWRAKNSKLIQADLNLKLQVGG